MHPETYTRCKRISDQTLMLLRMQGKKARCFYSAGEEHEDDPFPCDYCGYKVEEEA